MQCNGTARSWQIGRQPAPLSRNETTSGRYSPSIAKALANLPDETVVDEEIIALNQSGIRGPSELRLSHRCVSRPAPGLTLEAKDPFILILAPDE
jgi:hypothetical protein